MRAFMSEQKRKKSESGAVALITVVIVGLLILTIGVTSAFQSQTETLMAGHADYDNYVRNLAQTCADEALFRLKRDAAYAGGSVPIGVDSCTATVTGAGSARTVTATAASGSFTKTITVSASLVQNAAGNAKAWHVDSWVESDPP